MYLYWKIYSFSFRPFFSADKSDRGRACPAPVSACQRSRRKAAFLVKWSRVRKDVRERKRRTAGSSGNGYRSISAGESSGKENREGDGLRVDL